MVTSAKVTGWLFARRSAVPFVTSRECAMIAIGALGASFCLSNAARSGPATQRLKSGDLRSAEAGKASFRVHASRRDGKYACRPEDSLPLLSDNRDRRDRSETAPPLGNE